MECEDFASSLAEKNGRLSREGHGRDRLSSNYRSFIFGKLPPPACPGTSILYTNGDIAYLTKGISHLLFIPYTNGDIAYIYIYIYVYNRGTTPVLLIPYTNGDIAYIIEGITNPFTKWDAPPSRQ